ncbi:hypothetical protein HOV30_gp240 [Erwinia phage Derbicus]|uniref:Uncharacterized protein n=1 Tax=Erwinia phage Derbicus TaxID=2530027 RepID=A0A482II78_9CAUD|nr:hypothetical protein HOV30_gp240 [Erwinia phage Derbicus]QBP07666.1 hypothetical protein DERBICUS_240 [Erwinia phage Derbicus]
MEHSIMLLNLVTPAGERFDFIANAGLHYPIKPTPEQVIERENSIGDSLHSIRIPAVTQLYLLEQVHRHHLVYRYWLFVPEPCPVEGYQVNPDRTTVINGTTVKWDADSAFAHNRLFVLRRNQDGFTYESGFVEAAGKKVAVPAMMELINRHWPQR